MEDLSMSITSSKSSPTYPINFAADNFEESANFEVIYTVLKNQYSNSHEKIEKHLFEIGNLKEQVELQNAYKKDPDYQFDKAKSTELKNFLEGRMKEIAEQQKAAIQLRDQLKLGKEYLTRNELNEKDLSTLATMKKELKEQTLELQAKMKTHLQEIKHMHADLNAICARYAERVENYNYYFNLFAGHVTNLNSPTKTGWFW